MSTHDAEPPPPPPPPLLPAPGLLAALGFSGPLSAADLALFVELLAGLVRAHVPLPDALKALGRDTESRRLCRALEAVQARVASGATLGEALRAQPGVFPELMIAMVEQGVASNQLHAVLMELVRAYRAQIRFREALWSLLISPVATAVVLFVLIVGLSLWNLPMLFEHVVRPYDGWGIETPWATNFLFMLGHWIREPGCWALATAALAVGWFAYRRLGASRRVRHSLQRMALLTPVLGEFLRTISLAHACRLLSLLLQRGLAIDGAFHMAAAATSFVPAQAALAEVAHRLSQGAALEEALRAQPFFPGTFVQMAATAQRQGELPQALSRMADLYEERGDLQGAKVRFLVFVGAQVAVSLFVLFLFTGYFTPLFGFQRTLRRR
ncbi:MAG: type II secretion system F family protein [Planctomycetota bacterium]|nr:type II secretion system F family protein [Planctomycetota bacterium]